MRIWVLILLLVKVHVALSADTGEFVSVEKGDGIYKLLARYGISGKDALEEFKRINKAKLSPSEQLVLGRRYELPDSERTVIQPLFGESRERVRVLDQKLKGASFYLVSGHGGPDTGAIGREAGRNLYEDEYAYDVTLRLGRRLLEHSAKVHFIIIDRSVGIRNGRILKGNTTELCYPGVPIPRNQQARLQQRADAVNRLYLADASSKYRRCVVIHIDSRTSTQRIDTFFYHNEASKRGRQLATSMQKTFREKYQLYQPGRGYRGTVGTRGLFMLKHTLPPTAFIEVGNIQHKSDKERILDPANRQVVANWLADGIIKDFQISN